MAATTVASLHETAQALLDAATAAVATTVGGPVAESYLSPGLPAFDRGCDSVIGYAGALNWEATSPFGAMPSGHRFQYGAWVNLPTLLVTVVRCVHVGAGDGKLYRPPTPGQSTTDALKIMEDGWALWNGVAREILAGALFDGVCNDIKFQGLVPLTPQGGLAGWTLQVGVELGGYEVTP